MDENLRLLERRALLGDERALRALERSRIRMGRGWFDEELPAGLRVASQRLLYRWTPPRGYAIELVFVRDGGFWISRRPVSALLYATFAQARVRTVSRAAIVEFASACAYAEWAGLALPTITAWRSARESGAIDPRGDRELVRARDGGAAIAPPVDEHGRIWPREAAFRVMKR